MSKVVTNYMQTYGKLIIMAKGKAKIGMSHQFL